MNPSNLFSLNWKDVAKGLVTAVLAAVVVAAYSKVTSSTPIDWRQLLVVAEGAGLGYLVKNFFSDNNGQFLGRV